MRRATISMVISGACLLLESSCFLGDGYYADSAAPTDTDGPTCDSSEWDASEVKQMRYHIDENAYYSTAAVCDKEDGLNADAYLIHKSLESELWVGDYHTDAASADGSPEASHWRDALVTDVSSSPGMPQVYDAMDFAQADNNSVAIFSGHGNYNIMGFVVPDQATGHVDSCDLEPSKSMRMGSHYGNDAKQVYLMGCCLGYTEDIWTQDWAFSEQPEVDFGCTVGKGRQWQTFGFHNSSVQLPYMGEAAIEMQKAGSVHSVEAWITTQWNWGDSGKFNAPVAFTKGSFDAYGSNASLVARHFATDMFSGIGMHVLPDDCDFREKVFATISTGGDFEGTNDYIYGDDCHVDYAKPTATMCAAK